MTRGISNNNPMNIRRGSKWLGLVDGTDKEFCQFSDMVYGLRAALYLLCKYRQVYNLSLADMIYRWAPPSDGNNTEAYVSRVIGYFGLSRSEANCYFLKNEFELFNVASIMCYVESCFELDTPDNSALFRKALDLVPNNLKKWIRK